jgi:hypothetical protein
VTSFRPGKRLPRVGRGGRRVFCSRCSPSTNFNKEKETGNGF